MTGILAPNVRALAAGVSGSDTLASPRSWDDLQLRRPWPAVLDALRVGVTPRPAQALALYEHRLLESRKNALIAAPTNSGKSLLGVLPLLDAVRKGQRAVLIEPLRALAREKADEIRAVTKSLGAALGRPVSVAITTGDYRMDRERYTAPPPAGGEIVIATPERLDAILRDPAYDPWVQSIGCVTVDEAHMIADKHRGPTLETVLTTLLGLATPPRLILLSATMGDLGAAAEWLSPCDVIEATGRYPALTKEVWALEEGTDANDVIADAAAEILADPASSLLVFVYQTASANKLARELRKAVPDANPLAYHAQMSADERERVRSAMMDGRSRLVVSTTALSAGVNLPATHVLLRDTTFAGSGHLDIGQILQMMGRAGRGNQPGFAAALVRPSDAWHPDVLATDLEAEALPPLRSSFAPPEYDDQPWRRRTDEHTDTAASRTAALLARHPKDGMTQDDIQAFFTRSFGGKHLAGKVHAALDSLVGHGRRGGLAHKSDDGRYRLTALGLRAVRTMLPLPLAAGFAQLIRDLLSVDPEDKHILGWRPMDHLLLLDLLHDRTPSLRTFSEALAAEVDTWMDAHPHEEPLLFREWIRGDEENSKASQILGSLGISEPARGDRKTWARKAAYTSAFRAILLLERARGTPIPDLEKAWKAKNLAGVEERWRDDFLWLLSGLARILNPPCFTYHLRGRCEADEERERRVRSALRAMRHTAFSLAEELTYCSPLGGLLRTLRSDGKRGVGLGTLRRLEASGITSIDQLCDLGADEIARYGVRRDIAEVLATYLCAIPSDQP